MSCNCGTNNSNPLHYHSSECNLTYTQKGVPYDASCIFYTGASLTCSGITSGKSLETILQLFDTKLCTSNSTDFSLYDLGCLDDDIVIETEQEFVEAVASEICTLKTTVASLPTSVTTNTIQTQITGIVNPALTLPNYIGTTSSSSLNALILALGNKVNDNHNAQALTSVNWGQNYFTSVIPTTIAGGFGEILNQMGTMKSAINASTPVPTFNTTSACIPTKTSSTPLATVVNELLLQTCSTPTYVETSVPWGCLQDIQDDQPDNSLTSSIVTLTSAVNTLYNERTTFDSNYFTQSPNAPCCGSTISLREANIPNNRVATGSTDTNPGYLNEKVQAGDNIALDFSNPNQLTISATIPNNGLVRSTSGDSTPGTLVEKIVGTVDGSNGTQITISTLGSQLRIGLTLNMGVFASSLLNTIAADSGLSAQLCTINATC